MILQLRDVDMLELCSMFSSVLISLSLLVFVYAEVYYVLSRPIQRRLELSGTRGARRRRASARRRRAPTGADQRYEDLYRGVHWN